MTSHAVPSEPLRFNRARIEAFAAGDPAFAQELIRMFLQSAQACRDDFDRALDGESRRQALHKLKGAALTVGAERLAILCTGFGTPETGAALDDELRALAAELEG